MTPRTLHLATFAACLGLAVWVFWPKQRSELFPAAPSLLLAIPDSATLVIEVDLAEARRAGLAGRLRGAAPMADGASELSKTCGFDPTDRVRRLVFAVVPSREDPTDFGVAAEGTTPSEALIACAVSTIRQRGGRPVVTPIGSFHTVRDDRLSDGAQIAARDPAPTLVASAALLRRMMDAADGRIHSLGQSDRHRALRARVGTDGLLVASWVRLGSDPELEVLPIVPDEVLGAALGVSIGETVRVDLVAEARDPKVATDLATHLEPRLRRLVPAADARIVVRTEGASALARIDLSEAAALRALEDAEHWVANRPH